MNDGIGDRWAPTWQAGDDIDVAQAHALCRADGVLVRALEPLLPRPDLMFILTAPTSVIRSRKDEVPVDERERQPGAYRALAARGPQAMVLGGTRPPLASTIRHAS